jgi:O-antigen/teichoic acid export membrane protein
VDSARRIARNTGIQIAGDAVGKIATLAFYVIMARELGVEEFGQFTFGLSVGLLLAIIVAFGLDEITAREVARDRAAGDPLLWAGLVVKLVFGAAAVIVAAVIASVAAPPGTGVLVVVVLTVAAVVEVLSQSPQALLHGREHMAPIAWSFAAQRVVTAVAGITALALGVGVLSVAVIYLGGTFVLATLSVAALRSRGIRPAFALSYRTAARLVRMSFAIGLSGIFAVAVFRIDATMLGLLQGQSAVGLYGAAYRPFESTLTVTFSFVGAVSPVLARLTPASAPTISAAYELAAKALVAVLLPLGLGFVLFAGTVIDLLFGPSYADAASALALLGGAAALYGVTYLAGFVLLSQDRQAVIPVVTATALLLNVAGNLVVIPRWSYDGAAAMTSVTEVLLAAAMTTFAVRATGGISAPRVLIGPVLACGVIGLVALMAGTGLFGLGLSIAAYPLALLAVERRLFPEDLRLVKSLLARGGAADQGAPSTS